MSEKKGENNDSFLMYF